MSDAAIAAATGIPLNFARAIRAVESNGNPSAVRFEPHVFWKIRKGLPDDATGPQIYAALSPAELAQVPYTPGNTDWRTAHGLAPCRISRAASCVSAETNRAAYLRAYAVSAATAVRATSFGLYQVLGGDLLALYANDPARAKAAFDSDPAGVSEALLVHFLNVTKVRAKEAAIAGDVPAFVHYYNGCGRAGHPEEWADSCRDYIRKFEAALQGGGGGGIVATFLGIGALVAAWKWLG